MRVTISCWPRRVRLEITVIVLLGALMAPCQVAASCGHHVRIASEPTGRLPTGSHSPLPKATKAHPFGSHSPCSGPYCSNAPDPMPSEPSTPTVPATEAWASLSTWLTVPGPDGKDGI